MKRVLMVAVVAGLFALAGCEDAQLTKCQEQNTALQVQLSEAQAQAQTAAEAANVQLAQKDKKIAELQAKNTEDQNTAMKSISAMMTKQSEADKKLKEKLSQAQQQVKKLQQTVESLKQENTKLNDTIKNMTQPVGTDEGAAEKQM